MLRAQVALAYTHLFDNIRRRLRTAFALRLRMTILCLVLILSAAKFLSVVHGHYPIGQWLFWRYAQVIAISAGWAFACFSAGHGILAMMWRRTLPLAEHTTLAFATGVLAFFLAMFVGGIFALYGPTFAIALPVVMALVSSRATVPYLARLVRHLRHARRKPHPAAPLWFLPLALYGAFGIAMIYFQILTPENAAYDARWYHLPLAEHYAAQGAVRASPEGWFDAAVPHLASFLYTWAFLLPALGLFDHVELAAHLEFTVFLATLAGMPALVRTLLPRSRAPLAWTATFLFPGIFLYDSALGIAADHIAAFWAVPICISLRRALDTLEPRRCALFAAMLAGAVLTKYQAAALVAGPAIGWLARFFWLGAKALRGRFAWPRHLWQGPAATLAAGAALTTPHWLKNWIFYGDPFYPFLHEHFRVHPWTPDSAQRLRVFELGLWKPTGTLRERLHETLVDGVLNFSFVPHDWPGFHGKLPVFGSLFTLLFVALPFLRKSGRTMLLFLCGNVGVFVWYWMSHQDRYLQALVPWMASAVAAALTLIWQSGFVARIAAVPLVAAQVVWGGDVYFFPSHSMLRQSPVKAVTDLLSAHFRNDPRRFTPYGGWFDVGNALPKGAKVLVHQSHIHLGLRAMSVSDADPLQGGISYGRLGNPQAVYELLRSYGVTHLLWNGNMQWDSLAGDLVFWQFAKVYGVEPKSFANGLTLAKMPSLAPIGPFSSMTIVRACGGAAPYADGVYELADLTLLPQAPDPPPPPTPRLALHDQGRPATHELAEAGFAVTKPGCDPTFEATLLASFLQVATRGELQLWARLHQ